MLSFSADSQKNLSEGVHQSGLTLHGQQSPTEQIPFFFCWLNVPLCSFLYLHCHHLEFAFKLISSVNVRTRFEKPEVLQFIIISFVFFLIFSPSPDRANTTPSVAYCLKSEQPIPVFSSAYLTPVLLEINCGTGEC